jgi:hypothetical protein
VRYCETWGLTKPSTGAENKPLWLALALLIAIPGTPVMFLRDPKIIQRLFLLNILLQVFDGVATYQAVGSPAGEGNPLVAAAMTEIGVGYALLLFKAKACGCLVMLRGMAGRALVGVALSLLAATYGALSFFPWMSRILAML